MANTIVRSTLSPLGEILIEQLGELLETLTKFWRAISNEALKIGNAQRSSLIGVGDFISNLISEAPSTRKGDDMIHPFVKTEDMVNV